MSEQTEIERLLGEATSAAAAAGAAGYEWPTLVPQVIDAEAAVLSYVRSVEERRHAAHDAAIRYENERDTARERVASLKAEVERLRGAAAEMAEFVLDVQAEEGDICECKQAGTCLYCIANRFAAAAPIQREE